MDVLKLPKCRDMSEEFQSISGTGARLPKKKLIQQCEVLEFSLKLKQIEDDYPQREKILPNESKTSDF